MKSKANKAEAKSEANKAGQKVKTSAAVKLVGTKQKVKKQAATDKKEVEQKTAAGHAAPAKENAPVKRCSAVSFPSARIVLVSATLFFAVPMALRSNSSMSTDAAEVVPAKSVSNWADQQCGMHDGDVCNDSTAVQEAFETTRPADEAKGFAYSALIDPTATERAGLRVEKKEDVACQLWWLPVILGAHGGGDVDDGKPHRDLTSHQPAEQPTPADSPSHAPPSSESFDPVSQLSFIARGREMITWCTSSALLCALLFLLSAYAFNGKVATSLLSCAQHAHLFALHLYAFTPAPSTLHPASRTMAAAPDV